MRRFTTSDGLSLACDDEGAGLPLLCIPGLTRNGADFDELVAARGDRHRMIRLTLRGRGASDRDPDPANYNVGIEARDVVEFLDHLGLARVTVVGTSRGGLIAMLLAATAHDRLAGVLLNDIGPELAPEGLANILTYLGVPPKARSYAEVIGPLRTRMAAFPGLSDAKLESLARRWFDAGEGELLLNYDPRIRDNIEATAGQAAPDMWPLFEALAGIPVAVVRGANSDLLSAETVERMRERRPDLIVAVVPDRGHVPFLDEPEALAALDALLARVAAWRLAAIRAAAARARGIRRTPMLGAAALDRIAGRRVLVKAEACRSPDRSRRGAPGRRCRRRRRESPRGSLAFSSGNHAQGIAWAAAAHRLPFGDPDAVGHAGAEGRGDPRA